MKDLVLPSSPLVRFYRDKYGLENLPDTCADCSAVNSMTYFDIGDEYWCNDCGTRIAAKALEKAEKKVLERV